MAQYHMQDNTISSVSLLAEFSFMLPSLVFSWMSSNYKCPSIFSNNSEHDISVICLRLIELHSTYNQGQLSVQTLKLIFQVNIDTIT